MIGTAGSRLSRAARLSLVALVASLALASAPAHAAFPGANGKIAFTKRIDTNPPYSVAGPGEIYTMNPDGTALTNITSSAASDTNPAWSPDGTKILFDSDRSPAGIYLMNADGSNPTFLVSGRVPLGHRTGARSPSLVPPAASMS